MSLTFIVCLFNYNTTLHYVSITQTIALSV